MCEQETRGATVPAGILFTLLQFRLNLIECKQHESPLVGAKSYVSTELDNSFHLAGKNNYDLSDKNRGTGGPKFDQGRRLLGPTLFDPKRTQPTHLLCLSS